MKTLSLRATILLVAFSCLAISVAIADDVVTFPSSNSFSCNTVFCTYLGDNMNQSAPLYTAGDFVTEIFFNGPQSYVKELTYDFFLINNLGGNPGSTYRDFVYVNSSLAGSFMVGDCNYCFMTQEYKGDFNFSSSPVVGNGTYALSIVLADSVPSGGGSETFLAPGSVSLIPEPSTTAVLGSGLLIFAGLMRRKLVR
jgi:hypothetical protein